MYDVDSGDLVPVGELGIEPGFSPDAPFMEPMMDPGMGAFPAIFGLVFLVVAGVIIFNVARAGTRLAENASSPSTSRQVRIVARRSSTSDGHNGTPVQTRYYVTFEDVSGERVELKVPHREYGHLVEGDRGTLTHQGTWFKGFDRSTAAGGAVGGQTGGGMLPLDGTWEPPAGNVFPKVPGTS